MREIRFRAWDKKRSCLFEFELTDLINIHYANRDDIYISLMNNDGNIIIQQFTGLYDKNGKDIYEGDVVRFFFIGNDFTPLEVITTVFFHEGVFTVVTVNDDPLPLRDAIKISNKVNKGPEIIGNIYENPNLLTSN